MRKTLSLSKNRSISKAAHYVIDSLEKRQLFCALHSGSDESLGTFPAPEPTQVESAPSLETGPAAAPLSALPQLSSRVTATRKIFLDFDGANIPTWGTNNALTPPAPYTPGVIPAYTADADATTYSDVELTYIRQVWNNVAEKFSPFDVDVTTIDPGNRTDGLTMACVIGGTNAWYGSGGGVAYVDSFTSTRDNTCFVWSQGSGTNINFMGAGAAHELGHAFGLKHQGITTNGVVTTEYTNGSGQIVPIMGNANNTPSRRGIWSNGQANNRANPTNSLQPLGAQDDLSVMTNGHNNWSYRPDDYNSASSGPANFANDNQGHLSASGIINTQFDADGFKFTAGGPAASFEIKNATEGGMLSPRVELVTYPGNVAVSASVTVAADGNSVNIATANLTVGTQYALNVHGDFTYGSIGQYTVTGTMQTIAYAQGGVLYVNGFNGVNDDIQLDLYFLDQTYVYVDDAINGNASQVTAVLIPYSQVNSIVITTGSGNDNVRFLRSIGVTPTSVDMGSDINNLQLMGSPSPENFTINASNVTFINQPIAFNDTITALTCRGAGGDDSFTVIQSSSTNVALYGGDNNDTAYITSGVMGSGFNAITFLGENGTDTMVVGDGGTTAGRSFTVSTGLFPGTGAITTSIGGGASRNLQNQTVEVIRLIGSENADDFHVNYVPVGQVVKTEGYGGDDVMNVGSAAKPFSQDVRGQVDALGGTGDDLVVVDDSTYGSVGSYAIQFARVANNFVANLVTMDIPVETLEFRGRNAASTTYTAPAFTSPGVVRNFRFIEAPGAGIGSFLIDDRPVISQLFAFDLYPGQMVRKFGTVGSFVSSTIDFSGYESIGVYASNITHDIGVYGTSPDVPSGQQTTLIMGNGADTATLYPHDAEGNLTFNTNFGIGGGAGADRVVIDDTASTLPITYQFTNTFGAGTQNIYGMGSPGGFGAGSDVESITVNAGSGDDVFNIDQYKSGSLLALNGGDGNDTCAITPTSKNVAANVTSIAGFNFDGGEGADSFAFNNDNSPNAWAYTRYSTYLRTERVTGGAYFLLLNQQSVENLMASGGTLSDQFFVKSMPAVSSDAYYGGDGNDAYHVGDSMSLSGITGRLHFDGGTGTDGLTIDDRATTVGRTYHAGNGAIGAVAGDDLFPGGYITHANLFELSILSGGGTDNVFVAPDATAEVYLEGNDPLEVPGDTLTLALAGVVDPVIDGTPESGSMTAAASHGIYWAGFEGALGVDDTAPTGSINGFDFDSGVPMNITAQFSEDLSATLTSAYMSLSSPETGPIPSTDIFTAFDTNTNLATVTFTNYPSGALPDGNYNFTILDTLPDAAGNVIGTALSTDFWWLNADATRDRIVDTQDFNAIAGNFGEGTIFSQGDFNFDAVIDSLDFDLFVAQYGKRLAELPNAAPVLSVATNGQSIFSAAEVEDTQVDDLLAA